MLADLHHYLLREYLRLVFFITQLVVCVDNLVVTLEDPEDHRVSW